jgi:hypothetical protein
MSCHAATLLEKNIQNYSSLVGPMMIDTKFCRMDYGSIPATTIERELKLCNTRIESQIRLIRPFNGSDILIVKIKIVQTVVLYRIYSIFHDTIG